MVKILALGNEFIKQDSFAKEVSDALSEKGDYEIINIKDSFQFLEYLQSNEKLIILDVVENLKGVRLLEVSDLINSSILSAHDLDAGFFLQLIKPDVKIIGVPMQGNLEEIQTEVEKLLKG